MKTAAPNIPGPLPSMLVTAPRRVKKMYRLWCDAIAALDAAPMGKKARTARVWSRRLGILPTSLWSKRSAFRKNGPAALVDKRFSSEFWSARRPGLPPLAIQHLKKIAENDELTLREVFEVLTRQLKAWRQGDDSAKIPGYDTPPAGNPPPGWSPRNLAHALGRRPRKRSERILFAITLQFHANGLATWKKVRR